MPKIIDFGIAKAIGHRLTEKTLHTQRGLMIGTPAYMSPELVSQFGRALGAQRSLSKSLDPQRTREAVAEVLGSTSGIGSVTNSGRSAA